MTWKSLNANLVIKLVCTKLFLNFIFLKVSVWMIKKHSYLLNILPQLSYTSVYRLYSGCLL